LTPEETAERSLIPLPEEGVGDTRGGMDRKQPKTALISRAKRKKRGGGNKPQTQPPPHPQKVGGPIRGETAERARGPNPNHNNGGKEKGGGKER